MAFTRLKMAALAPIPSANVITATAAKPGLFAISRSPWRRSCRNVLIVALTADCQFRKFRARRFSGLRGCCHVDVRHRNTPRRLLAEIPEDLVHHSVACHLQALAIAQNYRDWSYRRRIPRDLLRGNRSCSSLLLLAPQLFYLRTELLNLFA